MKLWTYCHKNLERVIREGASEEVIEHWRLEARLEQSENRRIKAQDKRMDSLGI